MNTINHTSPIGEELKPCPFCGGKAVFSHNEFHGDDSMAVCSCCGATAFWRKWNRRADSRAQPIGEDAANGAMGEREARAIRLLEIAEPILEAAAVRKAVTIAAGDLLRQVRAFLPRAALTAEKVAAERVAQTDAEALYEAWQTTFDHIDAQRENAPQPAQPTQAATLSDEAMQRALAVWYGPRAEGETLADHMRSALFAAHNGGNHD